MSEGEEVWALIARVLAFVLGAVVVVGLVIVEERPFFVWSLVVALALMGPTFVASLATLLSALKGQPEEGQ